jgi:integrase/recombinase XerD
MRRHDLPKIRATDLSVETIERFRSWLCASGHPETTQRVYASDLTLLLKWIQEALKSNDPLPLSELEDMAMLWLNHKRREWAAKTTLRRLTSVKSFAKWAGIGEILDEYIAPKPARSLPHPIHEGIAGVISMCEAAVNPEHVALVAFGGFVGCRVAESLAVRPKDFDLKEKLLTIHGKGDKRRIVPVSDLAWTYLAPSVVFRFSQPEERVIQYGDRFAREIISNLARKAGLRDHVSSHDLRMTFATAVLDKTQNIRTVQELLGHENVNTTQNYTLVAMDSMRKAVQL